MELGIGGGVIGVTQAFDVSAHCSLPVSYGGPSGTSEPLGLWFPRLLDPLAPQQMLGRIEPLFKLKEAAGHVLERERLCLARRRQNRWLGSAGRVSSKENNREPHRARYETRTQCPQEYLRHRPFLNVRAAAASIACSVASGKSLDNGVK